MTASQDTPLVMKRVDCDSWARGRCQCTEATQPALHTLPSILTNTCAAAVHLQGILHLQHLVSLLLLLLMQRRACNRHVFVHTQAACRLHDMAGPKDCRFRKTSEFICRASPHACATWLVVQPSMPWKWHFHHSATQGVYHNMI
jgi:hypothetical protein